MEINLKFYVKWNKINKCVDGNLNNMAWWVSKFSLFAFKEVIRIHL